MDRPAGAAYLVALTRHRATLSAWLFLAWCLPAFAWHVNGVDGVGADMSGPARRIVSLAPHITDSLLALGAHDAIVGVIDDHPDRGAHARSLSGLPVVGDAAGLNYEVMLTLRPEIILAWGGGTPQAWIDRLRALHMTVLVLESRRLEEIPAEVEALGRIAGREREAHARAEALREQLAKLGKEGSGRRMRYFYQAWRQPLYSLQGGHLLSQALARCGADNILPPGPVAAPVVSPEFVLRENPDILFLSEDKAGESRAYWSRFSSLAAVREHHVMALDDPRLTRPGPDMLSAVEPVCAQISTWRKRKGANPR